MIQKVYRDYIQDMIEAINDIESFVAGLSFEQFMNDKKTVNAVIRSFEVMGEAAKNLPEAIVSQTKAVPWKKIAGMRDKLIHEYFGVDLETVWQTIKEDLPIVKPLIMRLQ